MHDQGLYKKLGNLNCYLHPILHFKFPLLTKSNVLVHAVFPRKGGSSAKPFDSLNVSFNVGDDDKNVAANVALVKDVMGARHLVSMNQVHGSNVVSLRKGDIEEDMVVPDCDAVVTNVPGVAVMVKLADCQGVILFSEKRKVLGIVHCGWRGNVKNILGKTVKTMNKGFGCQPHELVAAISPSLGPCCGEFVGYRDIFPSDFSCFMVRRNYFDLWAVSRRQLIDAGLLEEGIEVAEVCTKCNADLFFSYRKNRITGRFGVAAMLT